MYLGEFTGEELSEPVKTSDTKLDKTPPTAFVVTAGGETKEMKPEVSSIRAYHRGSLQNLEEISKQFDAAKATFKTLQLGDPTDRPEGRRDTAALINAMNGPSQPAADASTSPAAAAPAGADPASTPTQGDTSAPTPDAGASTPPASEAPKDSQATTAVAADGAKDASAPATTPPAAATETPPPTDAAATSTSAAAPADAATPTVAAADTTAPATDAATPPTATTDADKSAPAAAATDTPAPTVATDATTPDATKDASATPAASDATATPAADTTTTAPAAMPDASTPPAGDAKLAETPAADSTTTAAATPATTDASPTTATSLLQNNGVEDDQSGSGSSNITGTDQKAQQGAQNAVTNAGAGGTADDTQNGGGGGASDDTQSLETDEAPAKSDIRDQKKRAHEQMMAEKKSQQQERESLKQQNLAEDELGSNSPMDIKELASAETERMHQLVMMHSAHPMRSSLLSQGEPTLSRSRIQRVLQNPTAEEAERERLEAVDPEEGMSDKEKDLKHAYEEGCRTVFLILGCSMTSHVFDRAHLLNSTTISDFFNRTQKCIASRL